MCNIYTYTRTTVQYMYTFRDRGHCRALRCSKQVRSKQIRYGCHSRRVWYVLKNVKSQPELPRTGDEQPGTNFVIRIWSIYTYLPIYQYLLQYVPACLSVCLSFFLSFFFFLCQTRTRRHRLRCLNIYRSRSGI